MEKKDIGDNVQMQFNTINKRYWKRSMFHAASNHWSCRLLHTVAFIRERKRNRTRHTHLCRDTQTHTAYIFIHWHFDEMSKYTQLNIFMSIVQICFQSLIVYSFRFVFSSPSLSLSRRVCVCVHACVFTWLCCLLDAHSHFYIKQACIHLCIQCFFFLNL